MALHGPVYLLQLVSLGSNLKKIMFICACSGILGLSLEGCRRLRVISTCSNRRFQSFMNKYGLVATIILMKFSMNVI